MTHVGTRDKVNEYSLRSNKMVWVTIDAKKLAQSEPLPEGDSTKVWKRVSDINKAIPSRSLNVVRLYSTSTLLFLEKHRQIAVQLPLLQSSYTINVMILLPIHQNSRYTKEPRLFTITFSSKSFNRWQTMNKWNSNTKQNSTKTDEVETRSRQVQDAKRWVSTITVRIWRHVGGTPKSHKDGDKTNEIHF